MIVHPTIRYLIVNQVAGPFAKALLNTDSWNYVSSKLYTVDMRAGWFATVQRLIYCRS